MKILRSATLVALALGTAGVQAQTVISRQVDTEPVETTVTQTPAGTVITRRPLAPAPVAGVAIEAVPATVAPPPAAYMAPPRPARLVDAVGVAPEDRGTRHVVDHVVHHVRRVREPMVHERRAHERSVHVRRSVDIARRVAPLLVLAPAERAVIYRTIVQQQVLPAAPMVPGYPPFPAPARSIVPAPVETTGVAVEAATVDDEVYGAAPAPLYAAPYAVGSVVPADMAVNPLPARATVAVPAAASYSYVRVGRRVLLVDPATDTVVADVTP